MRQGLGLIRVSKVGDRGDDLISPELQSRAIETYSAAKDIRIVAWVEALDESGSQRRSKWWETLDATISRLEAERLDCIVVWKFSRVSRNRLKWAVALDRIETAGATLESATEGVDTTTSTGRFTRGMLAELEAFRAEQIGDVWREVKARRLSLGLPTEGQRRFGYDIVNGLYVPNEWAPAVLNVYEQLVAGAPLRQMTQSLNEQGATTTFGNRWEQSALRRSLNNGFAAGMLKTQAGFLPGAHEPIISMGLWEEYQRTIATRSEPRSIRYEYSGLLRCWYCKHPLCHAPIRTQPPGTRWRCDSRRSGRADCPGSYAWGPTVNRYLTGWVEGVLAGTDDLYQAALRTAPVKVTKPQKKRLAQIENELVALGQKNLRGFYDDETYLRMRADLLDEQRMLRKETEPAVTVPPLSAFEALLRLPPETRNTAWRLVLQHVWVRNKEEPKYQVLPRWVISR